MKSQFFTLLAILSFGYVAYAQVETSQPVLRFQWDEANYLFYDTYDLQSLEFESSLSQPVLADAAKKVSVISGIEFAEGKGRLFFSQNPRPSDIRRFAEKLGIQEFYVNDVRILTECLLNPDEVLALAKKSKTEPLLFDERFNETNTLENVIYNIHFHQSKIYEMLSDNYSRCLYSGYVTKHTELLHQYQEQQKCYTK